MDTNARVSASDIRTFSKRLRACVDAKELQRRQGVTSRLRRSCENSIEHLAIMLVSDGNNNSRSVRARRNWKRSYYCCYWIGVSSLSVSGISPQMEADNNNNNNLRRAELPDVVQEVNRFGHRLQMPVDQQNRLFEDNMQDENLDDPAIYENDDCIRFGRQLMQIGDDFEENYIRAHGQQHQIGEEQHQIRDVFINLLRVVFGAIFGINLYIHA